jgi:hypothetical protein
MGNPTQFFLPRSQVPANYGDLLRNAGLGEGISWGGSELDFRPDVSPDAIAKAEALAAGAPPGSSTADVMRFLAMQQPGGAFPSLPTGGGGDSGSTPAGGASPSPGGENPAAMDTAMTGGINLSPGTGAQAGSLIGGVGGSLLGAAAGHAIPGAGVVLGPVGGIVGGRYGSEYGGRLGETIQGLLAGDPLVQEGLFPATFANAAPETPAPEFTAHDLGVAGSLGITDPSTQGFRDSTSRTGYRDIAGRELPSCFLAGTLVKTVVGHTAIDEIEPGVQVPTSKGISTIYRVFKGYEADSYRINGIAVTGYHPFARPDGTWTAARDLKVGDEVRGFGGDLVIEQHEHVPTAAYVWNLLVEPAHEFYVQGLHGDYLVHNGDGVRRDDAPPPRAYNWVTLVNRGHEFLLDPRTHRSVELTGARLARQRKSGLPLVQDPRGRRMRLDDGGDGEGEGGGAGAGAGAGEGYGSGEGSGGPGGPAGEASAGPAGSSSDADAAAVGLGTSGLGSSSAAFGGGSPATGDPSDPANAFEPEDSPPPPTNFTPSQITQKMSQGGPVANVGGSWTAAPKFQHGGQVPMSERDQRLARIRAFEKAHGAQPV